MYPIRIAITWIGVLLIFYVEKVRKISWYSWLTNLLKENQLFNQWQKYPLVAALVCTIEFQTITKIARKHTVKILYEIANVKLIVWLCKLRYQHGRFFNNEEPLRLHAQYTELIIWTGRRQQNTTNNKLCLEKVEKVEAIFIHKNTSCHHYETISLPQAKGQWHMMQLSVFLAGHPHS